jgi:asparagine synthase (glutamine-hydrolysing)
LDEFVVGPRAIQRGLFNPSVLRRLVDEHRSGQDRHNDRLWMLVNLELWQRVFIDGEDRTAVMRVK